MITQRAVSSGPSRPKLLSTQWGRDLLSGELHGGRPGLDIRKSGLRAKSPDPEWWLFWDPLGPQNSLEVLQGCGAQALSARA